MRNHADITTPGERAQSPSLTRRGLVRVFGRPGSTRRRRPQPIEIDVKLQASHVRPAAYRPALY